MKQNPLTPPTQQITDFRAYEAAPGISVILLPDAPVYTHVAVSNDFLQVTGMKKEEVIGKGYFDVFPQSTEDPKLTGEQILKASFHSIIQHKHPHEIPVLRYAIPKGDGTLDQRYWNIKNAPILSDDGEVLYIVHTAYDITMQVTASQNQEAQKGIARQTEELFIKETQLELERTADRFKAVFNAAQWGMFTFAPVQDKAGEIIDFRFVITNPAFANYVGQTPEVLNGELGSTWFPGYLTNGVFDMYKKTYLTGETLRIDIHYNVDQHDIYLDLQSAKVGDEVLVTFNDFTALKRAQIQLEKTIEELRRSNVNLEEFAYAASHDLKEPVRKIQVFTDRLRMSLQAQLSEEQQRFFERVEFAAKRMSTLIDDLLLYSYVTRGAAFGDEVDLNKKVALVLQDLDLEIEQKGAKITIDLLPVVAAHRRQMQQLFHNLIGNALKYSKPGVAPEIHIGTTFIRGSETPLPLTGEQAARDYHLIEVRDNGIGFQQEDAGRIFNVFTRLHGNAEYRGSGVGLSIVQRIVENHNGFIWAESKPGEGATFRILLPK